MEYAIWIWLTGRCLVLETPPLIAACPQHAWDITAGGRKGELRVHTLDRGEGPLLFSVEALRSLGAVIDFQADLAVFRNLDPTQVVQLERSSTGHQLLPLTEDLFAKATKTAEPVPGLSAYL